MLDHVAPPQALAAPPPLPTSNKIIFWATLGATTAETLPTLYEAFQYLPRTAGSTEDADFWLLVQGSSMQAIGFIVSALAVRDGTSRSNAERIWVYAVSATGFLCILGAIIAYPLAPLAVSTLLNCTGGAMQAFLVVYLLLPA